MDMLEKMDLTDVSDHEALDVFLNSGGDENSSVSAFRGNFGLSCTTCRHLSVTYRLAIMTLRHWGVCFSRVEYQIPKISFDVTLYSCRIYIFK